ncbi:hypothetical protein QMK33_04340 [Hymenobacter sp. H14-R3]|uniref:hypothetical protein n=1 Tax=Hymenobacter sp. H14-R3 TaxID=3046308 RepID=UPI0024BA1AA3|nr:hypothetical protein [Hymenobacter sp. H14-R3]MDJ0364369.1 hypothetical protein [Hymenobacter sp. H14-R3]
MQPINTLRRYFRQSARLGTGRAYLLARDNPDVDFSAAIIEVALKNFAYDGQAEGSRAQYVFALYGLSKHQARIRRAVLAGLATEHDDTWTLQQLFELALLFAQHGDAPARQAMYHRFLRKPIHGSDWVGARELMALDGLAGLRYVAQKFGRALAKNPDDWQDDHLIKSFQEDNPTLDAWADLRHAAQHDDNVRRYLHNVEATRARQEAYQRPARELPGRQEMIEVPRQRALPFLFRKKLQPTDLEYFAKRLLTEKSKAVIENILFVFGEFKYPLDYRLILELARQQARSRYRLAEFATAALQHLSAPEIRAFALQKLATTTRPSQYTDLLISNYQTGDAGLLTAIVQRSHHEHTLEQLACSYVAIYEATKTPECAPPLLALYHKMTCGIHRSEVVRLLLENQVLPIWLNEELPFDSSAETQLLHQPTGKAASAH